MFRITEDSLSGSLVQCLAKNYKNCSVMPEHDRNILINLAKHGHDRIILVIFSQALYKAP